NQRGYVLLHVVLWSVAALFVALLGSALIAGRAAMRTANRIDPCLSLSDMGLGLHRVPTTREWKVGWGFMFSDAPSPKESVPLSVYVGIFGRVLFTEPPS